MWQIVALLIRKSEETWLVVKEKAESSDTEFSTFQVISEFIKSIEVKADSILSLINIFKKIIVLWATNLLA